MRNTRYQGMDCAILRVFCEASDAMTDYADWKTGDVKPIQRRRPAAVRFENNAPGTDATFAGFSDDWCSHVQDEHAADKMKGNVPFVPKFHRILILCAKFGSLPECLLQNQNFRVLIFLLERESLKYPCPGFGYNHEPAVRIEPIYLLPSSVSPCLRGAKVLPLVTAALHPTPTPPLPPRRNLFHPFGHPPGRHVSPAAPRT